MKKKWLALICTLLVCACAPVYQYTRPDLEPENLPSQVVVVLDYLSIVDDVGARWDYRESVNQKNIKLLERLANDLLKTHGFNSADKFLTSSGLGLDEDFLVDYYVDGQPGEEVVKPPYFCVPKI